MRFPISLHWQVDGMRRDIKTAGPSIVAGRRAGCETSCIPRTPSSGAAYARTAPEGWGVQKALEKRAIIGGRDGGAVLLSCCANRRPRRGERAMAFRDPNSVGRGTGKGARLPNWAPAALADVFLLRDAAEGAEERAQGSIQVKSFAQARRRQTGGSRVEQPAIGI